MSLASFAAKFMAGASRAERRKVRRGLIARSFTRFLARRPIWDGKTSEKPAQVRAAEAAIAWREEMDAWRERWSAARENSATYRRPNRKAIKAAALRRWCERSANFGRLTVVLTERP